MKTIPLLNKPEQKVWRIADGVLGEPEYRVFAKPRLEDVLTAEVDELCYKDQMFLRRAHFDFVVVDERSSRPLFAIEFDGPSHKRKEQKGRDIRKNRLCSLANFPLLRVNRVHLDEHDKTTLLEFMLRRYKMWPVAQQRLTKDVGEYVATLTQEEFNGLVEGGVADPFIDPNFYFDFENPFPGIDHIADRLFRRYGVVTDFHDMSLDGPLSCHVAITELETGPTWVATCGYVLYRPNSDRHVHLEHHYFEPGEGDKLYEGNVTFGMNWSLQTSEDWQPDEATVWFGEPPGIDIPSVVEWFSKYLALRRVELWAIEHQKRLGTGRVKPTPNESSAAPASGG